MLEKPLTCPNCEKKFYYEEVKNVQDHPKEAMPITCPNCRHVYKTMITNGYFTTFEAK